MAEKYNVEAAEILAKEALHMPISESVPIYEQLVATFPTAAKYWKQYVEAYMAANNDDATKQIFSRCLLNCLQVPLWRSYIRFIRKVNDKKGVEGQEETRKAYDFMLSYVGADIASGSVWMEYIAFLKSMSVQTAQEESQRMTAIRKAYQKAIVTPNHLLEQLWRDYEGFENSVSRALAFEEGGVEAAVIIGGMVLDIHATPFLPPNPRTTTPGKVRYVLGGVARNVAECMSKLGTKPFMISALGLDMAGNLLMEHWKFAGLSVEGIRRHRDIETPTVCNVFDTKGEVSAGVANVEAVEKYLVPEWIHRFSINVRLARIVMIDANLSFPALVASCKLAAELDTPVWFEPVSVAKSKRVVSIAEYITFASPNEDELIAMANALSSSNTFAPIKKDISSINYSTESLFQMLRPAILVLLEKGIKIVIVTLGSDGIFLCSKGSFSLPNHYQKTSNKASGPESDLYKFVNISCSPNHFFGASQSIGSSNLFVVHFPALSATVARLTGAGDCLVGGTLASICAGLNLMQSLAVGIAAAKGAVQDESNVPTEYDLAKLADDAKLTYDGAKILFRQSML